MKKILLGLLLIASPALGADGVYIKESYNLNWIKPSQLIPNTNSGCTSNCTFSGNTTLSSTVTINGADATTSLSFPTVTYTSNMTTLPLINIVATENTGAGTHDYLKMVISRTGGSFNFIDLFGGATGTTSEFSVDQNGNVNVSAGFGATGTGQTPALQSNGAYTANNRILRFIGTGASSNTGSNNTSSFDLAHTLNTSGVTTVYKYAVTDTAHGAGTLLMQILGGASATTNEFSLDTAGNLTANIFTTGPTTGVTVANVAANSCGTTAATIAGNENIGSFIVGATSGTQCRVTFTTTAPNRRHCTVTDETTTIATRATYVDTTHTDFFGAFVAGDVVTYNCEAR